MSATPRHLLAVFLKFPEPGRVKTRLAAELGADEAAEIYRDLVAQTLRHLPWAMLEVWLCFDPPERREDVKTWLGTHIPPHAVCPGEHPRLHWLATQRSPGSHAMPQPPQFKTSSTPTQRGPHGRVPAGQGAG